MKLNLHSHYNHFPNHKPIPFEPCIECYNDDFCYREQILPNSVALLIEPRSIQPRTYAWMEENYRKFRYVFTHDSKLLSKLPNAKLILWGGGCGGISQYPIVKKTKTISLVSSDKTMCELHRARIELARALKDNPYVDVMGTIDGGEYVEPDRIYQEYKFSIAFENYIDDYWFTEKICNCFANKTIPIYFGCKFISEFFNPAGIIQFSTWPSIEEFMRKENAMQELEKFYNKDVVQAAVDDNYQRVQAYRTFEYWFFNEYGGLLDDLYSETQRV